MRLALALALAFMLAGCEATGEIRPWLPPWAPTPPTPIVAAPAPSEPLCQARARHFVGTVPVPCSSIAQETRD